MKFNMKFNKNLSNITSRGIRTLALSAILATISPSIYSQSNKTKDEQSQTQTTYVVPQTKTINVTQDNMQNQEPMHDMYYCVPKYEELHFLRKTQKPTFSSKEVWTFDRGQGTNMFVIDCNDRTIENILDNVDFKDRTIRENLNIGNYQRIQDSRGREFLKFNTLRGERFFTIQSRDETTKGAIDIDGRVVFDSLENRGHKMLRLYIQMGNSVAKKNGRPVINSLDSGEILIPYFDCVKSAKSSLMDSIRIDTVFQTKRDTLYLKDSLAKRGLQNLDSLLHQNTLKVAVLGSAFVFANQEKIYQCGEFDFRTRPMLWKMNAYAKIDDRWHMNSKVGNLHSKATFSDTTGANIGNYGLNSSNVVIDARIDPWNSKKIGVGFGTIFNYDAATQKGSVYDFPIDASNERNSGLLGVLMFIHNDKFDNLSIGAYGGYSQRIGSLFNATARLDDYEIIPEVIVDSRLYLELFNGDKNFNKGNRGGFEVQVSGPQFLNFLRPTVAYEFEKTLYEGETNLENGMKHAILFGVTADLGRFLKKHMNKAFKNESINDARIDSLNNRINLSIDSLRLRDSTSFPATSFPTNSLPLDSILTDSIKQIYFIRENNYMKDSINVFPLNNELKASDSIQLQFDDSIELKVGDSIPVHNELPIYNELPMKDDESEEIMHPLRRYNETIRRKYNSNFELRSFQNVHSNQEVPMNNQDSAYRYSIRVPFNLYMHSINFIETTKLHTPLLRTYNTSMMPSE